MLNLILFVCINWKNLMLKVTNLKKFSLTVSLLCCASLTSIAYAAPAKTDAESRVEFKSSLPVTQEEVAAVDVLGEICPKIIGKNSNFDAGYKRLLSDLLPKVDNPALAIASLKDDSEYQTKLTEARADANRATVKENREVCLDIINYPGVVKGAGKAAKK